MKINLTGQEVIEDLHEKGYTNDFQLVGNDLLWVQKKIFIRAGDFSILECHRFCGGSRDEAGLVIFGVLALYRNVKGILINHYTTYTKDTPPVIAKKIKEMRIYAGERKS